MGILVPWNAFISAKSYFESRFCGGGHVNFESTFAMLYNVSSVLSLSLVLFSQWSREKHIHQDQQVETVPVAAREVTETDVLDSTTASRSQASAERVAEDADDTSPYLQVIIPLGVFLVVFLTQTCVVAIPSVAAPQFWRLTIFQLSACGVVTSVATAGIVQVASSKTFSMVEYFLAGQSFGGVAVALTNWVAALWNDPGDYYDAHCASGNETKTALPVIRYMEECVPYNRPDYGMMTYFGLGSLVMVFCISGYIYVLRIADENDDYESIHSDRGDLSLRTDLHLTENDNDGAEIIDASSSLEDDNHCEHVSIGASPTPGETVVMSTTREVWYRVWAPCLCIFTTFVVTLALFPAWTSSLQSVYSCRTRLRLSNDMYVPTTFLIFNICDLGGRILSSKVDWNLVRDAPRKLVVGSLVRVGLIPLLFACQSSIPDHRWPIVHSDVYSWFTQCAFGLSNGFLVTTAFVVAPTLLSQNDGVQQARSSTLLTLSVSLGLLMGSLLSYPVIQLGSW